MVSSVGGIGISWVLMQQAKSVEVVWNVLSRECIITSLTMFYKRTERLRTIENIQDYK